MGVGFHLLRHGINSCCVSFEGWKVLFVWNFFIIFAFASGRTFVKHFIFWIKFFFFISAFLQKKKLKAAAIKANFQSSLLFCITIIKIAVYYVIIYMRNLYSFIYVKEKRPLLYLVLIFDEIFKVWKWKRTEISRINR